MRCEMVSRKKPSQPSPHWSSKDYGRIARRVGRTPLQRLKWLVESFVPFADEPAFLPDTTPEKIARQVVAFILLENGSHTYLAEMPMLPAVDLHQIARDSRAGLVNIVSGKSWDMTVTGGASFVRSLSRRVYQEPVRARSSWQFRVAPRRAIPILFLFAAMELVEQEGHRLMRCPGRQCGRRLFVREDARQRYCRPQCEHYEAVARSRGKRSNENAEQQATARAAAVFVCVRCGVLRQHADSTCPVSGGEHGWEQGDAGELGVAGQLDDVMRPSRGVLGPARAKLVTRGRRAGLRPPMVGDTW
jgi:hypothetical protein